MKYLTCQRTLFGSGNGLPIQMRTLMNQAKHGLFEIGNIKDTNGYCPAMSHSPPITRRINYLMTYTIRTSPSRSRKCSPTPRPCPTLHIRHLCIFRRSSMAAHFLLNLEILRPRLLSGIVQSVQFSFSPPLWIFW